MKCQPESPARGGLPKFPYKMKFILQRNIGVNHQFKDEGPVASVHWLDSGVRKCPQWHMCSNVKCMNPAHCATKNAWILQAQAHQPNNGWRLRFFGIWTPKLRESIRADSHGQCIWSVRPLALKTTLYIWHTTNWSRDVYKRPVDSTTQYF